jgi:hypothetical protein
LPIISQTNFFDPNQAERVPSAEYQAEYAGQQPNEAASASAGKQH